MPSKRLITCVILTVVGCLTGRPAHSRDPVAGFGPAVVDLCELEQRGIAYGCGGNHNTGLFRNHPLRNSPVP
jgi:hypothetical protein